MTNGICGIEIFWNALSGRINLYEHFPFEGVALGYDGSRFQRVGATSKHQNLFVITKQGFVHTIAAVSKGTLARISSRRVQTLSEIVRQLLHDCSIASRARQLRNKTGSRNLIVRGP